MKRKIFGRYYYLPTDALKSSRRIEVMLLEKYLNVEPQDVMCDIGSGSGYWMKRITGGARTVGIDIDPAMLLTAQAHFKSPKRAYAMTSAECMAFPDGAFTKIYGVCSVEHIPDKKAAFGEFSRCLAPGGILALTLDSLSYPAISDEQRVEHARKYSVAYFYDIDYAKACCAEAGLDITDHQYIIRSLLAHWFYKLFDRHPRLQYPLFPIAYPLIALSDAWFGRTDSGWKLAIRAVKTGGAQS